MTARLFVSVPVPPGEELRALLETLGSARGLRPVREDMLHLTLCFIGDIDESMIGTVRACMRDAVRDLVPFTAELEGIGAFPEKGDPRVIWVGTGGSGSRFTALSAAVRREFDDAGIRYDRKPFRPHVTVARVRDGVRRPELPGFPSGRRFGTFACDGISLVGSELTPSGAKHTTLCTETGEG